MTVDRRNEVYWLQKIWQGITGGNTSSGGVLTVKGQGPVLNANRLDVGLYWNRVGPHVKINGAVAATPIGAPAGGHRLLIQALSQNVRYTLDSTDPTASQGFQLKAGDPPALIPVSSNMSVRVIQEAATADIEYQWFD